jgi:hypothetical protein
MLQQELCTGHKGNSGFGLRMLTLLVFYVSRVRVSNVNVNVILTKYFFANVNTFMTLILFVFNFIVKVTYSSFQDFIFEFIDRYRVETERFRNWTVSQ